MSATSTTLTNVLKTLYVEPLVDQLNNDILVEQLLKLDNENFEGLKARIAVHNSRSDGVGSREEGDDLPDAGYQNYAYAEYDMAAHYARVQVSGHAIMRTKSSAGAFVRAFDDELRRIKDDVALDFARQTYGNGDGIIATVGATANSTTVTLSSAEPLDKGYLYVNMRIDIGTAANPTAVGTFTISDVNPATPSITVTAAANVTATTHKIFRKGNNKANATKEMTAGIEKLVSTAANTIGGIDASAAGSRYWDNLRDTAGTLSLSKLMSNWNQAHAKGARSGNVKVVTTPGLTRTLFETSDFKSNVRFVDSEEFAGGFEKISFAAGSGRLTLFADRLAPYGKVFFLDSQHLRRFSPNSWDFLARDGQPIKWVQNKDAWQAVLYRYANMGTDRRNTSLVMSGITDTGF